MIDAVQQCVSEVSSIIANCDWKDAEDVGPVGGGLYLLVDGGGRVWYVGQSADLRSRLRCHSGAQPKKKGLWSRARYLEAPSDVRHFAESALIAHLRPPGNVVGNPRRFQRNFAEGPCGGVG